MGWRGGLAKGAMIAAGLAVVLASTIGAARAQAPLDPATLFVGNGVTGSCPTGASGSATCPFLVGGTELGSFSTQLDLYQNSGGAAALKNPVLLIFGVANDGGTALNAGSIGSPKLFAPLGVATGTGLNFTLGTNAFGLNGQGFEGDMKSGDVYGFLGTISGGTHFVGADNSNSFVNWSGADSSLFGIHASEFGIYVYALKTGSFAGKDAINVLLNGLPVGSFAVGYGEDSTGKIFATAFTEAGVDRQTHQVPEPGMLLVFGTGLMGLVLLLGRRQV
jgi:hypothetical protein